MMRVKEKDTVVILGGKDDGKKGKVIEILPKKDKVKVKDLGVITKHAKPRKQGDTGGIKQQEAYFHVSKVMPVCTACHKAVRVNVKTMEDGTRVRTCNKCKEAF
ncbi:MAG TPA: 50S ribosomal protein L24 [Candidatus Babeliales bacterium]|nr:50S ribosomal protein L24 [Candidatus Babeliales bacterium]